MKFENKITAYDGGRFSLGAIRIQFQPRLWDVADRTETNLVSLNDTEIALTLADARQLLDTLTSAIHLAENSSLDFIVHDSGTITVYSDYLGNLEYKSLAEYSEAHKVAVATPAE